MEEYLRGLVKAAVESSYVLRGLGQAVVEIDYVLRGLERAAVGINEFANDQRVALRGATKPKK